jgi:hypothetical protein
MSKMHIVVELMRDDATPPDECGRCPLINHIRTDLIRCRAYGNKRLIGDSYHVVRCSACVSSEVKPA